MNINDLESTMIILVGICCVMTLIVNIILGLGLYFCKDVCKKNDSDMMLILEQLKVLHASVKELIGTQKRAINLQLEMLNLKQAEMTGEYDIVEEPIEVPANEPVPEIKKPKLAAPSSTPKIDINAGN